MEWSRWDSWEQGEPRWDVLTSTTHVEIDETVRRLADWVADRRRLYRAGRLPLSGEWWRRSSTEPTLS